MESSPRRRAPRRRGRLEGLITQRAARLRQYRQLVDRSGGGGLEQGGVQQDDSADEDRSRQRRRRLRVPPRTFPQVTRRSGVVAREADDRAHRCRRRAAAGAKRVDAAAHPHIESSISCTPIAESIVNDATRWGAKSARLSATPPGAGHQPPIRPRRSRADRRAPRAGAHAGRRAIRSGAARSTGRLSLSSRRFDAA
jgi:hypothetical protein